MPECIELADPGEIWTPPAGFRAAAAPTLLSDIFRLKLLQSQSTIWVDCDAFCLRPFQFEGPHVFGAFKRGVATGVLGLPTDSPVLQSMLEFALEAKGFPVWLSRGYQSQAKPFEHLPPYERLLAFYGVRPGFIGPGALNHFAKKHRIRRKALPERVFYPVLPNDHATLFREGSDELASDETISSVHFYGRALLWAGRRNTQSYDPLPPGSFAAFAVEFTKHLWER